MLNLTNDLSTRHDNNPVAQARKFNRIAGLDEHGCAFGSLCMQRFIYIEARPHIHPLSRLVGKDDIDGFSEERSGQGNLLLVAARKKLNWLVKRRSSNLESIGYLCNCALLPPTV